jgi:hypothetical protein
VDSSLARRTREARRHHPGPLGLDPLPGQAAGPASPDGHWWLHVLDACRRSGRLLRGARRHRRRAHRPPRCRRRAAWWSGRDRTTSVGHGPGRRGRQRAFLPPSRWWSTSRGTSRWCHPEALRALAAAFDDPAVEMATLIRPSGGGTRQSQRREGGRGPPVGRALLHSGRRPFCRDGGPATRWAHQGLYGYRRATVLRLASLAPTPLERAESLEQLRALENGIRIRCVPTPYTSIGVDTPEDLARAEALLSRSGA